MASIRASILKDHYKTILSNGRSNVIGDEPIESGGEDLGFSPSEFLCSALAACTSMTLRMYADRKEWPLDAVNVQVTFTRNPEKTSSTMHRTLEFVGNLTDDQRTRLVQIANRCNMHQTLSNPIDIITALLK